MKGMVKGIVSLKGCGCMKYVSGSINNSRCDVINKTPFRLFNYLFDRK